MRREKIDTLYLAKCRYYVTDARIFYLGDKPVIPKPDYVDYYTIVKKNDIGSFDDVCNRYTIVSDYECDDCGQKYYDDILSLTQLSDYVKSYDSLNKRECLLVLDIIEKTPEFKVKVGYFCNLKSEENGVAVAKVRTIKKKK